MSEALYRSYTAQVDDVSAKERTLVARINTAAVDHYQTVIDPAGIDLAAFRENPVVLWEHGMDPTRGTVPIARNLWVKPNIGPNGPELLAKPRFNKDEFSQARFEDYKEGNLRGWSVHVLPIAESCSKPTAAELRSRPDLRDCLMMYRASKLLEYSGVAVPGNAQALTVDQARSALKLAARGIWVRPELLEAAKARDLVEQQAELKRRITLHDARWHVLGDDGTAVGEYLTEAEALAHAALLPAAERSAPEPELPPLEPQLPPLVGRSFEEVQAQKLEQIRLWFAESNQEALEDLSARADLARGIV